MYNSSISTSQSIDCTQQFINNIIFFETLKNILIWVFLILGILAFIKIIFCKFHD